MSEREARQVAQRRAIDEKAAAIERQKAAEFEKKQRDLAIKQEKARKEREQGEQLFIRVYFVVFFLLQN